MIDEHCDKCMCVDTDSNPVVIYGGELICLACLMEKCRRDIDE